jgi:hypothetical protein
MLRLQILDNLNIKTVRLSAQRTGRLYPQVTLVIFFFEIRISRFIMNVDNRMVIIIMIIISFVFRHFLIRRQVFLSGIR